VALKAVSPAAAAAAAAGGGVRTTGAAGQGGGVPEPRRGEGGAFSPPKVGPETPPWLRDTVHLCTADRHGNLVSIIPSGASSLECQGPSV
jgi:hypothetical protein